MSRRSRPSAARSRSCETGDRIRLDVAGRRLDLLVDEQELARRREAWTTAAQRKDERGYRRLYDDHVLQANEGCDFDFLRGRSPVVAGRGHVPLTARTFLAPSR